MPTQGSWRPVVPNTTSAPSRVPDPNGAAIELVGLSANPAHTG